MQRTLTGLTVVVLIASLVVIATVKPAASQQEAKPRPSSQHVDDAADHGAQVAHAICVLSPASGSKVEGVLRFTQEGDSVTVTGTVKGLSPNGTHAIHVHEFGDVSAPDGTSAGSHYNPEGHDHALPDSDQPRHAGDMGNLMADGSGTAMIDETFDNFTIAGMKNPVLGRAVVVHEKKDDGGQPTGNAGGRIALGVIGVADTAPPEEKSQQAAPRTPPPAPAD